jgi:hypothetical protein
MSKIFERYHKFWSHAVGNKNTAVLLGFGFVFAQSQAATGMLLRSSLAKTPKSLAAAGLQHFFKRSSPYQNALAAFLQMLRVF